MNWRQLGYIFCLTSSFNCVLFQVLFAYFTYETDSVELSPEKIPNARFACLTCSLLHLVVLLISFGYLKGFLRYNPIVHILRILNVAPRHGPTSGLSRYRRLTDMDNFISDNPTQSLGESRVNGRFDSSKTDIIGFTDTRKKPTLEMIDLN
ncbi:hypothetical protein BEWA_007450 [Theileria equi strain WA]|uniref:Uncharacterized protein n=1 Tax=Theileria equi strain WA TaxID=1537102 RepID=L0B269_THEEQ|nr:hypothetical protein BEWA_007450 [Theileria equi strain WA]AFZ81336.1 hypothetical protein BEWA_007450 [Theileria equi strain WA]|eukprot:XP_004831002.1 hypothetical protein BEWA_007450 [Theileria equi strain WA]